MQSVEGVTTKLPKKLEPTTTVLRSADATIATVVGRALTELHSAIATALLEVCSEDSPLSASLSALRSLSVRALFPFGVICFQSDSEGRNVRENRPSAPLQRGTSEVINKILDAAALAGSCGGSLMHQEDDGSALEDNFTRDYGDYHEHTRGMRGGRHTPGGMAEEGVAWAREEDGSGGTGAGYTGGVGGSRGSSVFQGSRRAHGGGEEVQAERNPGEGARRGLQQQEDIL